MVNRPTKKDGIYTIKGKKYPNLFGSRKMVYTFGTAYKTTGNLTKDKLMKNKHGNIVSRKKHFTAKKEKRLIKHGYGAKKGKFGFVKLNKTKSFKKNMKGGVENFAPDNKFVSVAASV